MSGRPPAAILSVQQQRDRLLAALERLVEENEACRFDVLNPCWNWRATDLVGQHWGGGLACAMCNARGVLAVVRCEPRR